MSPVVLYGQSLGGAVAIYLAEKHQMQVGALPSKLIKIDALVIENTFTDMPTVARKCCPSVLTNAVWVYQGYTTWHPFSAARNGAQPISSRNSRKCRFCFSPETTTR
jgi:alpha-beta hydrolase superfamily lysophospholipase